MFVALAISHSSRNAQIDVRVAVGTVRQYACPWVAGVVVAGTSSLHFPNQPLLVQVVVVGSLEDVVVAAVVVASLQPNHPGYYR